jgi:hypothetical protein
MTYTLDLAIHRTTGEIQRSRWPRRPPLGEDGQPNLGAAEWDIVVDPVWLVNPDVSALADVPEKYWKVDGDAVVEMTDEEKIAKDELIRGPLEEQKKIRREDINARTVALINVGYEYPPGSGTFYSLSDTAQRNLAELDKIRDALNYPFKMASIDDSFVASVADAAEVNARYTAGLGRIQWAYATGNNLKSDINAAATQAELDAIIDNR